MTGKPLLLLLLASLPFQVDAYPLDGYPETGIRRVEGARMANEGIIPGRRQPDGAQLSTAEVDLRLTEYPSLEVPGPDPVFSGEIRALLGSDADRYGIAILDMTDPEHPRYAGHLDTLQQNIGSVGKLVVALGLFQALADAWPDDIDKRRDILRNTVVTADEFAHWDHHKIRIFDVEKKTLDRRVLKDGDRGSLWEYLDWALSASSNAASAMAMREAMLLTHYGKNYPVDASEAQRFFADTPAAELTRLFQATFFDAISRNGMDIGQLRQGSFFTRTGKQKVSGGGNSYGSARALVDFCLKMEQGLLVDAFSSREIKRLLYMTERRTRYSASPELRESAVYFKSGSLYNCEPEEGFRCGKYTGNARNFMNSVAVVETDTASHQIRYIVAVISNVLRKNSAVDHQNLATQIHRMLEKKRPVAESETVAAQP